MGLLGLLLTTPALGQVQDDQSVTTQRSLDAVVDSVLARNPALQASRLSSRIYLERRREVSLPDPDLTFTYLPRPVFTARGSQRWNVRLEQTIPIPGKIRLEKQVATLDASAAGAASEALENRLVFETKRAYVRLHRIDRQIALARDFQDRLRLFEEAAESRYVVGLGRQQEILKAQLERTNLDAVIAALEADRRASEEELARLQDDTAQKVRPAGYVPAHPPSMTADDLLDAALAGRPEVAHLAALSDAKEAEFALARKAWLPDLGLHLAYVGIAPEAFPAHADGRDALMVGASIRLPLFGGNRHVGVAEARIEKAQLELERVALESEIRSDLQHLVSRMRREEEQMRLLEESLIPQAETTVAVALSDYTSGRAGFLDLLDAERTRFAFQNDLEATIERYSVAVADLERTIGKTVTEWTLREHED